MSTKLLLRRASDRLLFSGVRWKSRRTCELVRYFSSNILKLQDRGIFQSVFPPENSSILTQKLESSPQCMYCGFDPTADSLHVGNLLAIIALLHCQRAGHIPIALLGGATALIGDPSGKTSQRLPISKQEVNDNILSITSSLNRIFYNHQQFVWKTSVLHPIKVLNNSDWYKDKGVIDFLADVGHHFRLSSMLNKHSVSSRLQSAEGMSFREFSYQVFQAYDWYHLLKTHNCTVQIGGHDQTGNIVAGHDFIGRATDDKVFGLTVPLVTSSTGHKIGKTEGNAIWLNPDRTSSYQLYQYFMGLEDSESEKYLKLFTFLSEEEVRELIKKQEDRPEDRAVQKTIAEQVTLLVHGEGGLLTAQKWTEALFCKNPETLNSLSQSDLSQLFENAPTTRLHFEQDYTIKDLCMKAGCFDREVDADRVIRQGGISFNHERQTQPDTVVTRSHHILENNITLIRLGLPSSILLPVPQYRREQSCYSKGDNTCQFTALNTSAKPQLNMADF